MSASTMRLAGRRLTRFLAVGGLVGVGTLAAQWGLERSLPTTRAGYIASMLVAYALGTVLAFFLHGMFTFPDSSASSRRSVMSFSLFAVGSGTAAVAVSALASWIRYGVELDAWLSNWAGTVAFAISTLIVAVFSFLYSRTVVFRRSKSSRR